MYTPLWCKSHFSFLRGASSPEELVEHAHRLGLRSLALTDHHGVYGVVQAHTKARELGVQLIIGSEITLQHGERVVLLVQNRQGYASLCRLLTAVHMRGTKGAPSPCMPHDLQAHAEGLLLLVADPLHPSYAASLTDAFRSRDYALLTRHWSWRDPEREKSLRRFSWRYAMPITTATEVLYHQPSRQPLHDVMTCIRHLTTLRQAGTRIRSNAQHALHSPTSFSQLFHDAPEAIKNTLRIAEQCTFSLSEIRYRYPSERLPNGMTSIQWLSELVEQGARDRYQGEPNDQVRAQIRKELALIEELDYSGYFLTMHEIVQFCRSNDILCQGRGSAANSVVCYCLGITSIDPVRMNLLFERFISKERSEPPDIDLDIAHQRREEVIQHVYKKYKRTHAAMVANVVRYRTRSAIRDVGKVFGLPDASLGKLSKLASHHRGLSEELIRQSSLDPCDTQIRHFQSCVRDLIDTPRHLSIHPGGFILGNEPVHDLVPVEHASMPGRTVIQWSKDDAEALGLFKVDLLGLGALSQLDASFKLIQRHYGASYSMATIPPDDPVTFELIQRADTIGVFQIESRAQMSMLPRLKPSSFYDLVIEVSIVRPGPITGGMVHPYLRRRRGQEEVTYPHACLQPVLERTLGVPLFQEQVMRIAVVAADYSPGEADQLRRDMAAWRRSGRIERHRQRLIERMQQKGIDAEFAERVFQQILGFGSYGFPESHAASFALISYATSWVKAHYPAAFYCSLLNAQPMGFYVPSTIVHDAKRHHVPILPIDVRSSEWDCTLERCAPSQQAHADTQGLRIGLRYVRGLSHTHAETIMQERQRTPFESLEDFTQRTRMDRGSLAALAKAGALRAFRTQRRAALWDAQGSELTRHDSLAELLSTTSPSFKALSAPELIEWDYLATHMSPRGHPIARFRATLTRQGMHDARTLRQLPDGTRVHYAGVVLCRQRPGTASGVVFMSLEDETGIANVVLWPNVFETHHTIAKTTSFLGVTGRVQNQDSVTHLIAESLWVPQLQGALADPTGTADPTGPTCIESRDFH
jgi:error-prone DNA polymerase